MKQFVIGIDVGGTNIKLGIIDEKGQIINRTSLSTSTYILDQKSLIDAIINYGEHSCTLLKKKGFKKRNLLGIGIGLPGAINPVEGIVHYLPNIPGWNDVPLKQQIEKSLKIPTFIDNDVNVITLGEWKFGAGVGVNNLICITLGTGVGGGLILNGQLYRGAGFAAGEIGHMPLNEKGPDCSCGGYGCLETYIGNKNLNQKALRAFRKSITLEEIQLLAKEGNKKAVQFWNDTAQSLGNGLVGAINLLNPQQIIVGGGVSKAYIFLFKAVQSIINKRAMKIQGAMVKIVRAKLGNDAGIIGNQVLVKNAIQSK